MLVFRVLRKLYALIFFVGFYFYELFITAIRIAWDVVTLSSYCSPGLVNVPLTAKSDLEISVVANLITFSPGSMVVDLSPDRKFLTVHLMFLEDEQKAVDEIKTNIERRVLEMLR